MPRAGFGSAAAELGVELDYKELASTFAVTGVGSANMADVSGMSTLQFTMPLGRPVWIELLVPSATVANANGLMVCTIRRSADNVAVAQFSKVCATGGDQISGRKRLTNADFAAGTLVQLKLSAHVNSTAASGSLLGSTLSPVSLSAIRA